VDKETTHKESSYLQDHHHNQSICQCYGDIDVDGCILGVWVVLGAEETVGT